MTDDGLLLPMKGTLETCYTDLHILKEVVTEIAESNNLAHEELKSIVTQLSSPLSNLSHVKDSLGQIKCQLSANSALMKESLTVKLKLSNDN